MEEEIRYIFCVGCRSKFFSVKRWLKHVLKCEVFWKTAPRMLRREVILIRDNYTCTKCHRKKRTMQVHHVIPLSMGGPDTPSNMRTMCLYCHQKQHPFPLYRKRKRKKHC